MDAPNNAAVVTFASPVRADPHDRLDHDHKHGGDHDAEQDRRPDPPGHQHTADEQADDEHRGGPGRDRATDAQLDRHGGAAESVTRRTNPASTNPMNAMKSPIPTAITALSSAGTASNTAVRRPLTASTTMTTPSTTTRPIASGQVI